jgi:hypothetical protein
MAIIPAYLVYGPRKSRLLVGESGYTWEGDYVFLELEFDYEEWLLEGKNYPVCLVFGNRAERMEIGEGAFEHEGSKASLKLVFLSASEAGRMLDSARSFVLGF